MKQLKTKEIENQAIVGPKKYQYLYTGDELLLMSPHSLPCLWKPFINKQGLVALTGSSDVGKSSLLRQLAISIVLKKEKFLGYELNVRYGRVIYYTTEDSQTSINLLLKKQLPTCNPSDLKGLAYIFNCENPLRLIEEQLKVEKTDAVIIDCFADIFDGQLNDNSSVRRFLNKYDQLSLHHDCTFIFLHHNGKRTEDLNPNKNHIIGSQGFEAKMRMVMDLRKSAGSSNRQLWFTKGNYLPEDLKKQGLELLFDDQQEFTVTGAQISKDQLHTRTFSAKDKAQIIVEVTKNEYTNLSIDKKLLKLRAKFDRIPSKGTLHEWLKEIKPVRSLRIVKKSMTEQFITPKI